MRWTKVWARLLGIAGAIVEKVEFEGEDLVVQVRLDRRRRLPAPNRDRRDLLAARPALVELGAERAKQITHVSADAGSWIANVVSVRCPNAVRCMDPFHVAKWATDALDQVRRGVWNAARRAGDRRVARDLKGARWALWKGGERISARQQAKLAWIERTNRPLYLAYLLKEHLRLVFQLPFDAALDLLETWLEWAVSSALQPFVELVHSIDEHLEATILNALDHGLSNARVEALNTRIRLITRRAYGFHSATPLIGLAMLSFGDLKPALPGRAA